MLTLVDNLQEKLSELKGVSDANLSKLVDKSQSVPDLSGVSFSKMPEAFDDFKREVMITAGEAERAHNRIVSAVEKFRLEVRHARVEANA